MNTSVLTAFLLMQMVFCRYQFAQEPKPCATLLNYLQDEIKYMQENDLHSTLSFRNTLTYKCRDVVDGVLSKLHDPPIIIWNTLHEWNLRKKIQAAYVFINHVEELNETLNIMKSNRYLYSNTGRFLFITCSRVTDYNLVKTATKLAWNYQLLNYALIYYVNNLEILEYNPYTNEILNVSASQVAKTNKLQNLHGYELKIFAVDDFPGSRFVNNRYLGRDGKLLLTIRDAFNTTIKFHSPARPNTTVYEMQIEALQNDSVDFSAMGGLMDSEIPWNITYSYPYEMDDLVLIIPLPQRNNFQNLLLVLDISTWICLIVSIFATGLTINFCKRCLKIPYASCDTFFELIRLSCTDCTKLFRKQTDSVKILLIAWIILCMLFDSTIQSAIIGVILFHKPPRYMTTLEEFERTDMKIFIRLRHVILYPSNFPLSEQFVVTPKLDLYNNILDDVITGAYVLPRSYAIEILKVHDKIKKKRSFYILKDGLVPALYVYSFPIKTPYLRKIDEIIRQNREFGFDQHFIPEHDKLINYTRKHEKPKGHQLNLSDMKFAFYVLFTGYVLSLILFISENLYYVVKNIVKLKYILLRRLRGLRK